MDRWQSGGTESQGARSAAGQASVTTLPGASDAPDRGRNSEAVEARDTSLLDLLPHPAFAIAVDGDDMFRFIYTNDAYRALRGDDMHADDVPAGAGAPTGDLRSIVPANALVAHIRAFARAARECRTISFETEWGATKPARRVAVDVTPLV